MPGARRNSVRAALIIVFASRYTNMAIGIGATMVLARLVTPAQTGLFSVAASIVLLAEALREFGIGEYLVQERHLTPGKIRTALGLTWLLSWGLGFAVFLARNEIARFYQTPELGHLIVVVAGTFLVAPFSSTVMALLNREMAFSVLFRISLARTVANQAVAIMLALFGFGAMALTCGLLAADVVGAVVALLAMPSWDHVIPSLREWRALASFGVYISSANIIEKVGTRAPDLIIGRLLGYEPLGLFNRANGVVSLFSNLVVTGVQAVAFPAFADKHRAAEDLRAPYLRTVTLISGVMLPVLALVAVLAGPLVRTLLGEQWLAVVPLVPLFCAGAAFDAMAPLVTPFLNATGRVRMVLRIALVVRGAQLLLVGGIASLGLYWLAAGQVGLGLVGLLVNAHYLRAALDVRLPGLLRAVQGSFVLTAVTAAVPFVALHAWDGAMPPWLLFGVCGSLGGVVWFAAVFALRHPLGRECGAILREMRVIVGKMA